MTNVLFTSDIINQRVAELGAQISKDYVGNTIDIICPLNGASVFCADLVRYINVPIRIHHLGFTSYSGSPKSGEVRLTLDVSEPMQARHLLLLDGVIVSGRTPNYIMQLLKLRQPASIVLCALITKPATIMVDLPIKYSGFELTVEIAAGYGIGEEEQRALPHIIDIRNV